MSSLLSALCFSFRLMWCINIHNVSGPKRFLPASRNKSPISMSYFSRLFELQVFYEWHSLETWFPDATSSKLMGSFCDIYASATCVGWWGYANYNIALWLGYAEVIECVRFIRVRNQPPVPLSFPSQRKSLRIAAGTRNIIMHYYCWEYLYARKIRAKIINGWAIPPIEMHANIVCTNMTKRGHACPGQRAARRDDKCSKILFIERLNRLPS